MLQPGLGHGKRQQQQQGGGDSGKRIAGAPADSSRPTGHGRDQANL